MSKKQRMVLAAIAVAAALFALHCKEDDNDDSDENNSGKAPRTGETDTGDPDTGDPDTGNPDTGEPDEADQVIGTLSVPETFDGTPVMFAVLFFESDSMAGMPDGFGETTIDLDAIEPGAAVAFTASQAGLTGAYSLAVTLYCVGGGNGSFPEAGVDWLGGASDPVTLGPGTGTIDVGEVPIFLAE